MFKKLLMIFTEPDASITDEVLKKKSRLLSIFLIVMLLLITLVWIYRLQRMSFVATINIFLGFLLFLTAYGLNRKGRYLPAAMIFVLTWPIAQSVFLLLNSYSNPEVRLLVPILGVFMSGLFLAPREIIIAAFVYILSVLSTSIVLLDTFSQPVNCERLLFLYSVSFTIVIITSFHNRKIEEFRNRQIKRKAHFLELVANVSKAIGSSLDTSEVLKTTVSAISSILGYYNNSIWFVEDDSLILRAYSFSNPIDADKEIAKLAMRRFPIEGIIGWAVRDGEVKVIPDTEKNPYFVKHKVELETRSECAFPIRIKGRIIAVLDVQSNEKNAFKEEDVHILSIVADQIAVALHNARLYEEAAKQSERLSAINRLARAVSSTLETDELLDRTFKMIRKLFSFDSAYIALFDQKNETVDYRIFTDRGRDIGPFKTSLKNAYPSTRYVINNKVSLTVNDFPRYLKRVIEKEYHGTNTPPNAILTVPLKSKERITGVISVQSYGNTTYTDEDTEFLQTLADQVSVALENANLFEELGRELEMRKELQNQLVQAQKMEAIGTLAGGIAHDFNNILTAIIGYTDLLLNDVTDKNLVSELHEIKNAAKRAASLTSQLLAFGRKQMLTVETLDLNTVVKGLEGMLRRLIMENIDLKVITDKAPCLVKSDQNQLNQIIMNLVVNAKDAMPEGGKLTIETRRVHLGKEYTEKHVDFKPGDYVMLAVSDSGIGMDSETIKHIFEPFFTTKGMGKGTGLGLSMVYGITKQTGGDIFVYSEPGRGTTFKIYLPAVESIASTKKDEDSRSSKSLVEKIKILLVEDEDYVRNVTSRILKNAGYTVAETGSTDEAVRIFEEGKGTFDLLITDVIMPGSLNGPKLAELLKKIHSEFRAKKDKEKEKDLRVLYISGYTENSISHQHILDSGIAFLQKPFSPEELIDKINQIFNFRGG